MTVKAHVRFLVGLGCGLGLVALGAVMWGLLGVHHVSQPLPVIPSVSAESPADLDTHKDIAALAVEVERLQAHRREVAQQFAAIQRELTALRTQSLQVEPRQMSPAQNHTRHSERGANTDRGTSDRAEQKKDATAQALTLEAESERADAHVFAQVDLIEGTLDTEAADPKWASATEDTLYKAFYNAQIPGAQLVQAECRATLCRLELSLDNAMSPRESVQRLLALAPWQGQGFVRMTSGESPEVVMYLAREGYALPQVGQ